MIFSQKILLPRWRHAFRVYI